MTLSAKALSAARDDIASVVGALESKDVSGVSAEGNRIVAELVGLEDVGWDDLLESLEDDELREQVALLRQVLRQRLAALRHIRQVGHSASFNLSPPGLVVNLTLTAGEETLDTRHDLEDALWVGVAVVEAVSEIMESMKDALNPSALRACIGSNFQGNLERAEAAIEKVRRIYEASHNVDTPE